MTNIEVIGSIGWFFAVIVWGFLFRFVFLPKIRVAIQNRKMRNLETRRAAEMLESTAQKSIACITPKPTCNIPHPTRSHLKCATAPGHFGPCDDEMGNTWGFGCVFTSAPDPEPTEPPARPDLEDTIVNLTKENDELLKRAELAELVNKDARKERYDALKQLDEVRTNFGNKVGVLEDQLARARARSRSASAPYRRELLAQQVEGNCLVNTYREFLPRTGCANCADRVMLWGGDVVRGQIRNPERLCSNCEADYKDHMAAAKNQLMSVAESNGLERVMTAQAYAREARDHAIDVDKSEKNLQVAQDTSYCSRWGDFHD